MLKANLSILLGLFFVCVAAAQDKKETDKWDVSNPKGDFNYKDHKFSTTEGTWMNLDVSPDGKTIVFDLLGDIYSISISGGNANVLRTGIPFEVQPHFSPDGSKILFTSDAGGGDNIWIMNADGSDAKQITKENFRLLNNSTWMPDGNSFVARKHFTSGRSLGAGEMWQYHITGGAGLQLTKKKNSQQDVNEPSISPDGRYLYYSEDMYSGGFFSIQQRSKQANLCHQTLRFSNWKNNTNYRRTRWRFTSSNIKRRKKTRFYQKSSHKICFISTRFTNWRRMAVI
jgi:Tol biopolymer transport system component